MPFVSHRLDNSNKQCFTFNATFRVKLLMWLVILLGIGVVAGAAISLALIARSNQGYLDQSMLITLSSGLGIILMAYLLLKFNTRPRVFDKVSGLYWKGRNVKQSNKPKGKDKTPIQEIHALQILG